MENYALSDIQAYTHHLLTVVIKNEEIYAKYFTITKSVAFNQQANIDEIDKLMEDYKDWEKKEIEKMK